MGKNPKSITQPPQFSYCSHFRCALNCRCQNATTAVLFSAFKSERYPCLQVFVLLLSCSACMWVWDDIIFLSHFWATFWAPPAWKDQCCTFLIFLGWSTNMQYTLTSVFQLCSGPLNMLFSPRLKCLNLAVHNFYCSLLISSTLCMWKQRE